MLHTLKLATLLSALIAKVIQYLYQAVGNSFFAVRLYLIFMPGYKFIVYSIALCIDVYHALIIYFACECAIQSPSQLSLSGKWSALVWYDLCSGPGMSKATTGHIWQRLYALGPELKWLRQSGVHKLCALSSRHSGRRQKSKKRTKMSRKLKYRGCKLSFLRKNHFAQLICYFRSCWQFPAVAKSTWACLIEFRAQMSRGLGHANCSCCCCCLCCCRCWCVSACAHCQVQHGQAGAACQCLRTWNHKKMTQSICSSGCGCRPTVPRLMHLPVGHSTSKCCPAAIKLPEFSASQETPLARLFGYCSQLLCLAAVQLPRRVVSLPLPLPPPQPQPQPLLLPC